MGHIAIVIKITLYKNINDVYLKYLDFHKINNLEISYREFENLIYGYKSILIIILKNMMKN